MIRRTVARVALVLLICVQALLAAALIAACGGGDPEPDKPHPISCQAKPEVCK